MTSSVSTRKLQDHLHEAMNFGQMEKKCENENHIRPFHSLSFILYVQRWQENGTNYEGSPHAGLCNFCSINYLLLCPGHSHELT